VYDEKDARMLTASSLFEGAVTWLQDNYGSYRFFVERDLVWTLQTRLIFQVQSEGLPFRIFHHFPVFPKVDCDLAILNTDDSVALAAEFKYEPSHRRSDIWHTKFPVVFWNEGVGHDIERVHEFVSRGGTPVAYAIFIDEGGHFRHRNPHPGSIWVDWKASHPGAFMPAVLWSCTAT
jgi:hypothetical protein